MSTEVATTETSAIERQRDSLAGVVGAIRNAQSVEQVTEFRARLEAARAWAKVHKKVQQVRLELLTAEVEALVRVVELGGVDLLPSADRKAAEFLAGLSRQERAAFVRDAKSATTAAGMCRSIWAAEELDAWRARGRSHASQAEPTDQTITDVEVEAQARQNWTSISGAVHAAAERMGEGSFTVDKMAELVMEDAGVTFEARQDRAFREGVREVVRKVARSAPALTINGIDAPRFITSLTPDGCTWNRIPTGSARVEHLDQMIQMRRTQLEQDRMALERLEAFRRALGSCDPHSMIVDALGDAITPTKRSAA